MLDGGELKAVFPGGVSSPVLGPESLDLSLDFDSMRDADSDLGSGCVIVVAEPTCMVQVTTQLAEFFYYGSCGKCQPCKDGTQRTGVMLHNLQRLDEKSIDRSGKILPPSLRKRTLNVISNTAAGVSTRTPRKVWIRFGICANSTNSGATATTAPRRLMRFRAC